jgi:hypothetical protein
MEMMSNAIDDAVDNDEAKEELTNQELGLSSSC